MMAIERNQLAFSLYCIENLAEELGKDTVEIYDLLKSSGILYDYIVPLYDILHTQSKDYIVEDILEMMRKKGIPS